MKKNENKVLFLKKNSFSIQVVGGGGLVVSPIQLLANHQGGFKVINQPNGLTTIELSPQSNIF